MAAAAEDPVGDVVWMIRGHWVTLALRAAVDLGVLDHLAARTSVAALASETSCDPADLRRLLRTLADLGMVELTADHVVATPRGATLARGHPSGLRDLLLMQTSPPNIASWQRLADAVRAGGSVYEAVNGIGPWQYLAAHPEQGAIFDAAMARRGSEQAAVLVAGCDFSGVGTVVDVGGGRGAMLAEVLAAVPGLRGVVADRPEVAHAAGAFLARSGLADVAVGTAADFFESVPTGGDVYTVANVLHDWADRDAVRVLQTIGSAMTPAARLWVVERVLDAPGRLPEAQRDLHLLDLHMLVMFGARERTAAEYRALLTSAGFTEGRLIVAGGAWDVIEARLAP
ncbi:methyltransferase [Cellulomonas sp. McL0617]|uniref:methyltransferase n=1 Tax=Cellulomonas sp. McL0617 TaxID=3415675 RepID=UPI003CF08A34